MEAKIITIDGVTLVFENEFSKHFKYKDIELYLAKAYDDETDKHYLVTSLPSIPELNVQQIQYPIEFESESGRDEGFKDFDLTYCKTFIDGMIEAIKNNQKEQNINQPEN